MKSESYKLLRKLKFEKKQHFSETFFFAREKLLCQKFLVWKLSVVAIMQILDVQRYWMFKKAYNSRTVIFMRSEELRKKFEIRIFDTKKTYKA